MTTAEFKRIPTVREAAEKFGVSTRTVSRVLKRDPRWWQEHRRDLQRKAAALRATGMTWEQIGAAMGTTPGAARAAARRGAGVWADSGQKPQRDERQQDLPL
jgi:DNA-directed RNA polymerase specialized sigma24 family protein